MWLHSTFRSNDVPSSEKQQQSGIHSTTMHRESSQVPFGQWQKQQADRLQIEMPTQHVQGALNSFRANF